MHLKQEYQKKQQSKSKFDYEIELNITFDCEMLKITISKIKLIVIVGYKK